MSILALHFQKLQQVNFPDINGRWQQAREDVAFVQEEEKLCEPRVPAALQLHAQIFFSVLASVTEGNQRQNPLRILSCPPPAHYLSPLLREDYSWKNLSSHWVQALKNGVRWQKMHSFIIIIIEATIPLALFYTYGNGDIEKHNVLKLGALAEPGMLVLSFPRLSSNGYTKFYDPNMWLLPNILY